MEVTALHQASTKVYFAMFLVQKDPTWEAIQYEMIALMCTVYFDCIDGVQYLIDIGLTRKHKTIEP
jgi:hypothetical protein